MVISKKAFYHPLLGSSGTTRSFVHPVFPVQQFVKAGKGLHDHHRVNRKRQLKRIRSKKDFWNFSLWRKPVRDSIVY
jgi:hypothetical protein